MAQETFCANCFTRIPISADICPVCGEKIASLSERDYGQKLVHALNHPLAEIRMRAIVALGLRREKTVAPALLACALRNPVDVVEGLAIVNSLRLAGGPECLAALKNLVKKHPARAIQQVAMDAISAIQPGIESMTGSQKS